MKKKKVKRIVTIVEIVIVLFVAFIFSEDKEQQKEIVEQVTDIVTDMATYEMSKEEIDNLASTEIKEQTEEQEKEVSKEQEVESEGFELQGEIAYEGDKAITWNIELGDYKGLTYYSQIDSRWSNKMYSSIGNRNQTIGTSGCGPTSASMIVTACKGSITPDKMSDIFVKYGYRSSNNGTYWSAFRAVADEFNLEYAETSDVEKALQLLQNNHYVVVSVGNGLFTTGGHFIVLTSIQGNTISVYDPYLYAGKFETSTRRGKASVHGSTVYVTIDNFKQYANYQKFFCYAHGGNVTVNNTQNITTANYTRYVKAQIGLNVRNKANGIRIHALVNGTMVMVEETNGNWSRITSPINGWVCSDYLVSNINPPTQIQHTVGQTKRLKACTLYSKSNLSGLMYQYKNNTSVIVLQNINSNIDKIKVKQTGRIAYVNKINYQ